MIRRHRRSRRTLDELKQELERANEERFRVKGQRARTLEKVRYLQEQLKNNHFGLRVYSLMKDSHR